MSELLKVVVFFKIDSRSGAFYNCCQKALAVRNVHVGEGYAWFRQGVSSSKSVSTLSTL